jgi:flagellar basal-body rod protein FlgG
MADILDALNVAGSGLNAQSYDIVVTANNIANQRTTGHKEHRAEFQDLAYQYQKRPGMQTDPSGTMMPTGIYVGSGVRVSSVYRILTQGRLEETGSDLDIALEGRGHFRIQLPDGSFGYTRDGSFKLDSTGTIVNSQGYSLSPAIVVPDNATKIDINAEGQVFAKIPGQIDEQLLGQIDIVTFINEKGLEEIGGNMMLETTASGQPVIGLANNNGNGSLLQGWLESSNIEPVDQITRLVHAQRAYEQILQCFQAVSDEARKTTDIR